MTYFPSVRALDRLRWASDSSFVGGGPGTGRTVGVGPPVVLVASAVTSCGFPHSAVLCVSDAGRCILFDGEDVLRARDVSVVTSAAVCDLTIQGATGFGRAAAAGGAAAACAALIDQRVTDGVFFESVAERGGRVGPGPAREAPVVDRASLEFSESRRGRRSGHQ